jgi:hypothetical protein
MHDNFPENKVPVQVPVLMYSELGVLPIAYYSIAYRIESWEQHTNLCLTSRHDTAHKISGKDNDENRRNISDKLVPATLLIATVQVSSSR